MKFVSWPVLRRQLRSEISAHPDLWRLYRRLRHRVLGEAPPPGPVHQLLTEFSRDCRNPFFVQVGSNDAAFGDPIIEFVLAHGWRGILVEPVPYVFERLRSRHGRNSRLILENTAIGDSEGMRLFYCVKQLERPLSPWYDQLGSFDRAHIEKHERFTSGISRHIHEIEVPCQRLSTLLEKHMVSRVDLLHIDAEGADFEVLKSLDFNRCTPGILLFEHGHLPRAARAACLEFIEAHSYRILHEGRDSFALHDSMCERWPSVARLFDSLAPER